MNMLGLAGAMMIFIIVSLCTAWAWETHSYILAVLMLVLFVASGFGLLWMFERWGPT